ncbi:MAG TPA: lipid-binding SYLF domain-containing protein [Terriglobales bacterium]|nr:lipid-binding SYLF domain-containing protein [Terriglobales bacterium]
MAKNLSVLIGVSALALAVATPLLSASSNKDDDIARLNSAALVFRQVMGTPDKAIPAEILEHAQCIAIIPGEKKAAFGVGGNYGKGVAMCRDGGSWGAPLFITIGGGSWGLQIGAQSSDVIMVFGNRSQLDSLLSSKFRIGAEASAAAGPVGRHVSAATDVKLNSEILTYGRSKGAFAGISLSGAVVQPDTDGNAAMYGANTTPTNILTGTHGVTVPAAARSLAHELDRSTAAAPAKP